MTQSHRNRRKRGPEPLVDKREHYRLMDQGMSNSAACKIVGVHRRAGVLGVYGAVYSLAGVIAPALTGRLTTSRGELAGLRTAWLILASLLVVSGVLAIVFIRPERDAARVTARLAPMREHLGGPPRSRRLTSPPKG